jgi:hypothetical protein
MVEDDPTVPDPRANRVFALLATGAGALLAIQVVLGHRLVIPGAIALTSAGLLLLRAGLAVARLNGAVRALNEGDRRRALVLLSRVRARHRLPYIHAIADAHHAEIAYRDGDATQALQLVERALARRTFIRIDAIRCTAAGLRAILLALAGDARTEAQVAEVRAAVLSPPAARARAELAVVLLRVVRGDLDGARRALADERSLLVDALPPRERILLRAAHAVVDERQVSRVDTASDAEARAVWLTRIFPQFTRRTHQSARQAGPALVIKGLPETAVAFESPAPAIARLVIAISVVAAGSIAVTLLGAFFLAGTVSADSLLDALSILAPSALVFVGVIRFAAARPKRERLERAALAVARGDLAEGEAVTAAHLTCFDVGVSAESHLLHAAIAARGGTFLEAVRRCDAGMARAASTTFVRPQLIALRALALAALGDGPASEQELARLHREHPAYPHAATARGTARLIRAVRAGDLGSAIVLARGRDVVGLSAMPDLVAEIVLALHESDAAARLATIRADLRPLDRAWLAAAVPGLLEALTAEVGR